MTAEEADQIAKDLGQTFIETFVRGLISDSINDLVLERLNDLNSRVNALEHTDQKLTTMVIDTVKQTLNASAAAAKPAIAPVVK